MNRTPRDQPTVVAVATPPGEGGLAVVRLSGPDAQAIASRVFRRSGGAEWRVECHHAMFGVVVRAGDQESFTDDRLGRNVIDRVLALPLLAPRSYTGEDTVEFFCHGGKVVSAEIVAACCAAGASPAPPGEFTRRAFLNGKLSLDQAEAVADLIHAGDPRAARGAIGQLMGGLDRELKRVETPLLNLLAELEGSLEFGADEEESTVDPGRIITSLRAACADIDRLLSIVPAGRILRQGVQVVLCGAPNVGKSSLFNALLQESRAIVDPTPGTTRDVVSARVVRGGRSYVLHDTAGLRPRGDAVELKGMARTRTMLDEADIILQLFSATEQAAGDTGAEFTAPASPGTTPVVRVLTKCDLVATESDGGLPLDDSPGGPQPLVQTSSLKDQGIEALWGVLERVAADFRVDEALSLGVVLNERHQHRLSVCREELMELVRLQEDGIPAEVTATILAGVLAGLGEVSGRVFTEQLLESVFRRFCVGK